MAKRAGPQARDRATNNVLYTIASFRLRWIRASASTRSDDSKALPGHDRLAYGYQVLIDSRVGAHVADAVSTGRAGAGGGTRVEVQSAVC